MRRISDSMEAGGYWVAAGHPELPRPVDLVCAVVVLEDSSDVAFLAVDDHLTCEGRTFFDHRVFAVIADNASDVGLTVAVRVIRKNPLPLGLSVGYIYPFAVEKIELR